jgi:GT2 family glycosyltransferase
LPHNNGRALKKVSTIIVTYNGARWIEKCLRSLLNSTLSPEIVVVDNGSSDSTKDIIKEICPGAVLIENSLNLGFGQANNKGITFAINNGADYVFLLNQDVGVENSTIADLVNHLEKSEGLGILSPLHLNKDGSAFDKYFLRYLLLSDSSKFIGDFLLIKKNKQAIIHTNFVNAAAWMMSKQCVVCTGGFDPLFFHYGEDQNYSNRSIFKGFKIGILTQAKIYHDRESRTSRQQNDLAHRFKHNWTNVLIQMTNIRHNNYPILALRKIIRHSWLVFINSLKWNKAEMWINCKILLAIIRNYFRIRKSRQTAIRSDISPFLKLG